MTSSRCADRAQRLGDAQRGEIVRLEHVQRGSACRAHAELELELAEERESWLSAARGARASSTTRPARRSLPHGDRRGRREFVFCADNHGRLQVVRVAYEFATFQEDRSKRGGSG